MISVAQSLLRRLGERYKTPAQVQKLLRTIPYNRELGGETLRSAYQTWKHKRAHCLEAAFLAAAILEQHGYPPLVMSLESIDDLDHVMYIFQSNGRWGAIARSREEGLHGRLPVFKTVRELAWSYVDPYVDLTGRVTGFGIASLDDTGAPWRYSNRNVWRAEQYLIDLKHQQLKHSEKRYERALENYRRRGNHPTQDSWW